MKDCVYNLSVHFDFWPCVVGVLLMSEPQPEPEPSVDSLETETAPLISTTSNVEVEARESEGVFSIL